MSWGGPQQQPNYGAYGQGPRPAYGQPPAGQPPAGQYGAPPGGQYGGAPPAGQYGAPPRAQYGAPPPGQQHGAPQGTPQYGAPQGAPQYGAPQGAPQYGAPQGAPQYGAPQGAQQYGAPQGGQAYGAPPQGGQAYGAPPQGGQRYGAPPGQQQASAPGQYGAPQGYGSAPPPAGGVGYGAQPPPGVSPEIFSWFQNVDADRSGKITATELQHALMNGNWSPFNAETCRLMIGMFDKDRNGTIDVHEFAALWKYIQDWKGCFDRFDTDRSGNIDANELGNAFRQFGYTLSPQFSQTVIRVFDRRRGGQNINFDDFIQSCVMLKTLTDKFREKDTNQNGMIQVSYEQFLEMVLDTTINK